MSILISHINISPPSLVFSIMLQPCAHSLSAHSSVCNTTLPQRWHSTNLVGVPSALIACPEFNKHPVPLHIAGTTEIAHGLFNALDQLTDPDQCGHVFQNYMIDVFGEGHENSNLAGIRRYKNSYLKLLQDWGIDSNSPQAAVLKGWVESRFGLFPTFHKQLITKFYDRVWSQYVEDKMHSRYHNNCIFMQLDLLFEYCQWYLQRFSPQSTHTITLYRGINSIEEQLVTNQFDHNDKIIRLNSIVSFTDVPAIAGQFGDYILKINVPLVKVIFFNDLLPHHGLHGESEYLVVGGDYKAEIL